MYILKLLFFLIAHFKTTNPIGPKIQCALGWFQLIQIIKSLVIINFKTFTTFLWHTLGDVKLH